MPVIVVEIEAKGQRMLPDDEGQMVEKPTDLNANWYAPFLQRLLRGRFDYARCIDRDGKSKSHDLPGGVPGQCLMLDTDKKVGAILEPLHDERYAGLRKKLVKVLGREREAKASDNPLGLEPERKEFELSDPRDVPTWLYWLKRAVDGGHARVVKGELPAKIEGKPKKQFFTAEPAPDPLLESQLRQQAMTYAMMTTEQRALYEKELARLKGT